MRTRAPGYSMGVKIRPNLDKTPGPGSYIGLGKSQIKGHYMGTSNRIPNQHPERTPGPGAYKLLNMVADVPDYAIRSRTHQ